MSTIYLLLLLVLILAWYQIPNEASSENGNIFPNTSVIIPIRNEEKSISTLIGQIMAQDYPRDRFEIILVNDHSTDNTVSIIERIKNESEIDLQLISLEDLEKGKKSALSKGIKEAKGEIILTTDGDCEVDRQWLKIMTNAFDQSTKMIFGPVAINTSTFFGKLQMVDFSALMGMGAATWKMGVPGMCNGANLGFRKDTFEECNGYEGSEQYPSGDDEFLLRKIHQQYPNGIRFVKSKEATTYTSAQSNLQSFVQQRIRWAGKWKLHQDITTKLAALFVFSFYATMLTATIAAFIFHKNINIIIGIYGVKWFLDVLLVSGVLKLTEQKLPVLESIVLSFIYPFYAIGIGISTINYTFEWKGRNY